MEPTPSAADRQIAPVPTHDFKFIRRKEALPPPAQMAGSQQTATHGSLPAFVINLARATERLAGFSTGMASHQWNVTLFHAIDRRDLVVVENSPTHKLIQHRRDNSIRLTMVPNRAGTLSLGLGHIACALSHMALWKKVVDEDLPHACLFEDDAQIISPWWDRPWPATADFIFLSNRVRGLVPHHIQSTDKLEAHLAEHPYIPLAPGCGTEAYIVTQQGARKALAIMAEIYMPVDLQLLSCAHGSRLIQHSLLADKLPTMPELEMWTTSHFFTQHENDWPSYVNER
ncbi:glycosyltransferase family 25 protein [Verrucomicrobium sp. BvORR106]|uniref:glycosyltransferase family 25 protein n=1 Tax=Verrucomicrobium sp. BvORR106 TaxID=1403819 RepID=UPI000570BCED|nr:glycosyltransferase family 25 protein [Verrucomicrobium sp. BvORR106]